MYKWKNWVSAFATVVLLTVSSCASWTPEQKAYTAIGATGGALVGGGVGCAIGLNSDEDDSQTVALGCGIGVLTGAVVGGISRLPVGSEAGSAASTAATSSATTATAPAAAGT